MCSTLSGESMGYLEEGKAFTTNSLQSLHGEATKKFTFHTQLEYIKGEHAKLRFCPGVRQCFPGHHLIMLDTIST